MQYICENYKIFSIECSAPGYSTLFQCSFCCCNVVPATDSISHFRFVLCSWCSLGPFLPARPNPSTLTPPPPVSSPPPPPTLGGPSPLGGGGQGGGGGEGTPPCALTALRNDHLRVRRRFAGHFFVFTAFHGCGTRVVVDVGCVLMHVT